ncbi:hypothetical protein [Actinoplanes sp. G11-F43]|uniref:hypothetical protein n=1 Tax=Actinoplanes sp. G11-F43 TaxID=3424130 RepID=UPI003D34A745
MEQRGPLALFGAIVAVGVGPALWLGAQLGAVDLAPGQRPAPIDGQFPGVDMNFGGAGAGEMPADGASFSPYSYQPVAPPAATSSTPRTEPAASATSAAPSPLPSRSVPPIVLPSIPAFSASPSASQSATPPAVPDPSASVTPSESVPPVPVPVSSTEPVPVQQ